MMPIAARFDRERMKWRCACGATLASVVDAERFELPTMEKQIVKALELPCGFVFKDGRHLKPLHTLPSNRGAHNANSRQHRDAFTRQQLERAQRKNDVASIVASEHKLLRVEQRQREPSKRTNDALDEVKPMRIFADELPVKIQCPNQECKKVHRLDMI